MKPSLGLYRHRILILDVAYMVDCTRAMIGAENIYPPFQYRSNVLPYAISERAKEARNIRHKLRRIARKELIGGP